jgi:pimeloyl-ACP methyl ester carboxylesterase
MSMPLPAELTSGYAPSGAARIYFETAGAGLDLIFVHAGVSDSRMWDPQVEEFTGEYRVTRYDHRGFGKSKMPDEPYALRDDLFNVIRHLGIAKAMLVGCSMGGATAIDFALEHSEMVSALVLVGSGVSGLNDPKQLSAESLKHWTEFLTLVRDGDVERAREMDAKYWIDGPSRDSAHVDSVYRTRARQLHRENFSIDRFARQEQPLEPRPSADFARLQRQHSSRLATTIPKMWSSWPIDSPLRYPTRPSSRSRTLLIFRAWSIQSSSTRS